MDIEELVGNVPYEKVWGLLVDGHYEPGLPPAEPHPLSVRTGDPRVDLQSALAMLAPEWGLRQLIDITEEQARQDLARVSVMALSFVAQSARGVGRPPIPQAEVDKATSIPERFLIRWRGEADPRHVKAIDAYWISAAEHGMNASTFTARVIASTGADVAAALSGAVGALSGPLHGGAPSRVLQMLDEVEQTGDAERWVKDALDRGDRLMGFGHRVYRAEDPRARVLRRTAREIGAPRLEVAEKLEEAALAELKARKPDRVLATNVEFWSAVVLDFADVPPELFTPMFASARVGGWAAHIMEQKREGRLIRPTARYVGPEPRAGGLRERRGSCLLMEAAASSRTKNLTLVAAILGTTVVTVDSTVVNVALPSIADDLGGGLAGQQWTANAYLITLSSLILLGRLARRPLRRAADVHGRRRRVRRHVRLLRGGADDRAAGGRPSAAGRVRRPPDPRRPGRDRRDLPTRRAREGSRRLDRVGRDRHRARAADRRAARRCRLVAVDLRHQHPDRPHHPRARDARHGAGPAAARPEARVDYVGAALCALGLAGFTYGLIEQPRNGWGDPGVWLPLAAGAVLFVAFVVWEARSSHPMLPLELFRRRNFAIGNIETFSMYAGLGLLFFFLVLFLQQVAGYNALEAGSTTIPVTVVMFLLSTRFGALADRHGPRFFMGVGPLVAAVGAGLVHAPRRRRRLPDRPAPGPAACSRSGLSMTVAPLTATVLADADESNAGHRVRGEQRDRARGQPDRDRGGRRSRDRLVRVVAARRPRSRSRAAPP